MREAMPSLLNRPISRIYRGSCACDAYDTDDTCCLNQTETIQPPQLITPVILKAWLTKRSETVNLNIFGQLRSHRSSLLRGPYAVVFRFKYNEAPGSPFLCLCDLCWNSIDCSWMRNLGKVFDSPWSHGVWNHDVHALEQGKRSRFVERNHLSADRGSPGTV